jgi:predicted transcriptional regulator of viral defense system
MKIDAENIVEKYGAVVRVSDLLDSGLSFRQIRRLVESGHLIKIDKGIYRVPDKEYDERVALALRIPTGVFCLYSASFIHQLSDFVPPEQHMAVPKKSRYVLPDFAPVKFYFWEETPYKIGVMEQPLEGGTIRVYDPEKTVCDFFRLSSKTGELAVEVLKSYLDRPDRNINKLFNYAKKLRVQNSLIPYLQVLS